MPGRTLLIVAILILAVSVPFLVGGSDSTDSQTTGRALETVQTKMTAVWNRVRGGSAAEPSAENALKIEHADALLEKNRQLLTSNPINVVELGTLPGISIADALRFDVTPEWVRAIWPRVTPQYIETGWYGTRVPWVTGTEKDDIAGSLTYYFDAQNYVQRVTLYGYTGSPERLISFVTQNYSLRPVPSQGRGLFIGYFQDVPINILKVQDAPVQSTERGNARHCVRLELNLPREGATLSEEVMEKLRKMREAQLL